MITQYWVPLVHLTTLLFKKETSGITLPASHAADPDRLLSNAHLLCSDTLDSCAQLPAIISAPHNHLAQPDLTRPPLKLPKCSGNQHYRTLPTTDLHLHFNQTKKKNTFFTYLCLCVILHVVGQKNYTPT
uniref:Uncharacterized protein n=1 Tax=Nothobranchius kadleci TaxID=1051664 RepID=A0A1A8BZV5_NOTKA